MIEFHYDATPNAWKVSIMLEECGMAYRPVRVDLQAGRQFSPEFLELNPNAKIPVIVDRAAASPLAIAESGAILIHLAEASGRFLPEDPAARISALQWLMWQMSGLGPTLGQNGHFLLYAPEPIPYALDRFGAETRRLYAVMDRRLDATGAYLAGEVYSIADMACFPWIMTHKRQGVSLEDFPAVARWFAAVRARPGVQRGLAAAGGPGRPVPPAAPGRD